MATSEPAVDPAPSGHHPRVTAPLDEEQLLRKLGYRLIAGIDEAGRGSWAGPVVAAAVVLPLDSDDLPQTFAGVRDSKQLTPLSRARLYDIIAQNATALSVVMVSAGEIDRSNILIATRQAMKAAIEGLTCQPDCLLLDSVRLDGLSMPQWGLVGGDRRSLSVAAASIVAKVTRDRYMADAEGQYPAFRFARHKGYGTAGHIEELRVAGPTEFHRRSFRPIRRLIEGFAGGPP